MSLESGQNYWTTSTCTTPTGSAIESIKSACKKLQELKREDIPELYVMQTDVYELIRREMVRENLIQDCESVSLYIGIPVEHYETLAEVHARVAELTEKGRSVAFVSR